MRLRQRAHRASGTLIIDTPVWEAPLSVRCLRSCYPV